MATVLIAPDLTVKTGTAANPYNSDRPYPCALNPGADNGDRHNVLVTITIMATVPIVRAITAKAATVRNALMKQFG